MKEFFKENEILNRGKNEPWDWDNIIWQDTNCLAFFYKILHNTISKKLKSVLMVHSCIHNMLMVVAGDSLVSNQHSKHIEVLFLKKKTKKQKNE